MVPMLLSLVHRCEDLDVSNAELKYFLLQSDVVNLYVGRGLGDDFVCLIVDVRRIV